MIYLNERVNLRVGLLFGGKSFEHDISIISANVIYHALKDKYDLFLMYIDQNGNFKRPKKIDVFEISGGKKYKAFSFCNKGVKCAGRFKKIDVIISVMHGINGEDGMAKILADLYDIPFVGSNHISSGALLDKHFTYALLCDLGIKTIETKFYLEYDKIMCEEFPLIIKPARLGSSIGISKVNNTDELNEKVNGAFKFDKKIIIQPFIEQFKEYNQAAYIHNGEVCVSNVEEVFKSDDILTFDDKYISTKVRRKHTFIENENLINKISEITKKIYKSLELSGIVRIDYMMVDGEILVNEINTTPGSLAYYLFDEEILILLDKQIHTALLTYQNKINTTFKSSILLQNYTYKK